MGDSVTDSLTILDTLNAEFQRLQERGTRSAPGMLKLVDELRCEVADLRQQGHELASLYEVAQELAAASELSDLLESIIDKAIVLVGAERGFVALARPDAGYYTAIARRFGEREVEQTDEASSSSLVNRVMERREPILTTNIQDDGRFELTQSIIVQHIRSVLAVPLIARGELQGAIYVDTRMSMRPFGEAELRLLQAMASQAAMAIRSARLYDDVRASNAQLNQTVTELRETQAQLVQAERLAAVGRLAASVAQQIGTPLNDRHIHLQLMERPLNKLRDLSAVPEPTPTAVRRRGAASAAPDLREAQESVAKLDEYLHVAKGEIHRLDYIITQFLQALRPVPRSCSFASLNDCTGKRGPLGRTRQPRNRVDRRPQLPPTRGPRALQQVLVNLVKNAMQAMTKGGRLTLRTGSGTDGAWVSVTDTGRGIPQEQINRLFEPCYTTKRKGSGLGLMIVLRIVRAHQGRIEVESQPGRGSTFRVWLPLHEPRPHLLEAPAPAPPEE